MRSGSFEFLTSASKRSPLLATGRPVMLYGAGNCGKELAVVLGKRGIPVTCFLDRNASANSTVHGIPVVSPDRAPPDRFSQPIIVSIFNRDVCVAEVADDLRRRGYASVHTLFDMFDEVSQDLGDRFWLTHRSLYETARPSIERAAHLFADEHSKYLYRSLLQFRVSGNCRDLPTPEMKQYVPDTIPRWSEPIRLVDGGAYNGDTIQGFLRNGYRLDALAAFEPESESFGKLCGFVQKIRGTLSKEVGLFPCALWSKTERRTFTMGQGEASHIGDATGALIQCVRLDDALPSFGPTMIKLDVEGAEKEALEGASRTIRVHLPVLAVCVYHRPSDLWMIPLQIRDLSERYRFYLRCHGHSGFDVVLYGVACA